jgi:hypothetical protein
VSEYWLGVLTPFALIAGLAIALAAAWALLPLAHYLNSKIQVAMFAKVKIAPNLARSPFSEPDDKPEYYDKATAFRDALLNSPKMFSIRALGHTVLIVRDYETVEPKEKDE